MRSAWSFVFHVSIFAYYSYLRTVWAFVFHVSIFASYSYPRTVWFGRSYSMFPFLRTIVTSEPFGRSHSMFSFLRTIDTCEPCGRSYSMFSFLAYYNNMRTVWSFVFHHVSIFFCIIITWETFGRSYSIFPSFKVNVGTFVVSLSFLCKARWIWRPDDEKLRSKWSGCSSPLVDLLLLLLACIFTKTSSVNKNYSDQ